MKRLLSLSVLLLTISIAAHAQDRAAFAERTRIARQGATITGDRGTFTIAGSETLNRGQFSFGVGWNNVDRTPKDLDITTVPVYFSYGLFSKLTLGAMVETHKAIAARNLSQTGFYGTLPFVNTTYQEGLGDTVLSAKYRLQRKSDNVGGLALKGFVKLGTADPGKGLGTKRPDIGAAVMFTSLLPFNFKVDTSLGYVATYNTNNPPRTLRDYIDTGLGVSWPSTGIGIGGGQLQGIFEYSSLTFVGCCSAANVASASVQNPNDIAGGVRFLILDQGLTFDAGYRINTKFDLENPNNSNRHGFIGQISYTQPSSVGLGVNRGPVVAVEADSSSVTANTTVNLTATGFDPDNDRLSYAWSASGGQVTGTGEKATFRATSAGTYVVRVLVSDGNGGTASGETEITVR
jgi:hypothetical protein